MKPQRAPQFVLVAGLLGLAVFWGWRITAWSSAPPPAFSDPGVHGSRANGETPDATGDADAADASSPPALRRTVAPALAGEGVQQRVSGRVVGSHGEPVVGALVGLADRGDPVSTDAGGRFVLTYLEAETGRPDGLELLTLAHGYAPNADRFTPRPELDVGDIVLWSGGAVEGSVVDESGRPIVDAVVRVDDRSRGAWPAALTASALFPATLSGPAGTFALEHLAAGQYRLLVSADGRQEVRSPSFAIEKRPVGTSVLPEAPRIVLEPIVLPLGTDLVVRVVDSSGKAIQRAAIQIRGSAAPRFAAGGSTDAQGEFTFQGVPLGKVSVHVEADRYLPLSKEAVVEADSAEPMLLQLLDGTHVRGFVVDAASGEPLENFAVVARRVADALPTQDRNGTLEAQLEQMIERLRAPSSDSPSSQDLELASNFERRLRDLRAESQTRVSGLGLPGSERPEIRHWPGGEFLVDGLLEGEYEIGVVGEHHGHQVQRVVLSADNPTPPLRFALQRGLCIVGTIQSQGEGGLAPLAGAQVELVTVFEPRSGPASADEGAQRSLYPWLFAKPGPRGAVVQTARTDADGRYTFFPLASAGRVFVRARHAEASASESAPFPIAVGAPEKRVDLVLGSLAKLSGRVLRSELGEQVKVLVLGGHGVMRTVDALAVSSDSGVVRYQVDRLPPGEYLVRAYPASAERYESRLFARLFPLHAGDVDLDVAPVLDVRLTPGENRSFDIELDKPAVGAVEGSVAINGVAAQGALLVLRPAPGEPGASAGLSSRGRTDSLGKVRVDDVPAGAYRLTVYGPQRHELDRRDVSVEAEQTLPLWIDVTAGALRGSVSGAGAQTPRGRVWVLPGASEIPEDLYAYRREHVAHRLTAREGRFEADAIQPGPALVVLDVEGHAKTSKPVVIPAGGTVDCTIALGQPIR
jgi:hypothetical protein